MLLDLRHIDATGFQNRAMAQIDGVQHEPLDLFRRGRGRPGMKLARTRKTRAPSRKSRLTCCTCPGSTGFAAEIAPVSISEPIACDGRMP